MVPVGFATIPVIDVPSPTKYRARTVPCTSNSLPGCAEPIPTLPPVNKAEFVAFEKVWMPVHVGAMDCDKAGAPSERIAVLAEPLTADNPIVPVGLATIVAPIPVSDEPSPTK